MSTTAERIIDFLANLQGMDRLQTMVEEGRRKAVIDLNTAAIIEADPGFPDAELLVYELPSGVRMRVHTHKLMEQVLVRHATELAVTEGGTVKQQYDHISEHFQCKTGFGQ